jgi:PhnB protein
MAAKPVPDGYHAVTPYLIVREGAKAIDFYKRAFGASESVRMSSPEGKIGHAEIRIGDSVVMLADERPDMGHLSPLSLKGTPVSLLLYVEDVDSRFEQALGAGAKALLSVKNQFYGDRSGTLQDPFGHVWTLATRVEDLSSEEVRRRSQKLTKEIGSS